MAWPELIVLAIALLGTGIVAGILAGLLGVGGGIVIVPVLFHVFTFLEIDLAVRMHLAVGTSLAIIVPTSLRSAWSHYRHGTVDMPMLQKLLPSLFLGVLVGIVLSAMVSGRVLTGVFGVIAVLVSVNMMRGGKPPRLTDEPPGGVVPHAIGAFVGTFSTMMGIGGGTLTVPVLDMLRYPIHRSVGTAAAVGTVISVPGFFGFIWAGWGVPNVPPFSIGYVSLLGFVLIAPLTVMFAPVGVRMAMSMNTRRLKLAFAVFLFLTALSMLYTTVTGG